MTDRSVIPPGGYCYFVKRLQPGEVLPDDIDRFGKDLRESSWHGDFKRVLCLYWRRTDYGMVRCEFLQVEGLDEMAADARAKALAHYGSAEALAAANQCPYLWDEVKVCDVRADEDERWGMD